MTIPTTPPATDVVVVPSAPLLLPEYAGLVDPAPDLRAACREAVGWLVGRHPGRVTVVASSGLGTRVARTLVGPGSFAETLVGEVDAAGVVVVANGSARRGEKAPGHLDERAFAFDDAVETALRSGEPKRLADLDVRLGDDLLADVEALTVAGAALGGTFQVEVDYAGDPFGVQYWVARWSR